MKSQKNRKDFFRLQTTIFVRLSDTFGRQSLFFAYISFKTVFICGFCGFDFFVSALKTGSISSDPGLNNRNFSPK